jgi:general stress protein YciG
MGGLDTPENLVEVTITQHAMFHFCNFQLWGNEEDKIAWRGLSGLINADEIKLEAQRLGARKSGRQHKENGTGIFKLSPEQRSENGRKNGQKTYENGTGVFSLTREERTEIGKKSGQKLYENGIGIFNLTLEESLENKRKGGQETHRKKVGLFNMSPEEKTQARKRGVQTQIEKKIGIFNLTTEERIQNGKKFGKRGAKTQHAQRWECTETGFISTPCGLSSYQKARGIDTSNRIRIQ